MDYERKYKQAFERAKEMSALPTDKATIEYIFPELKESEDEKTRKSIIAILDNYIDDDNTIKPVIMNWLEKQSKKKSADEVLKIRQELYQSGYNDGYKHGQEDTKQEIEKQGESTITNFEIPFGAKDSELQEVSYCIPEGFNVEIKDDRVVIKKNEQKVKVGNWVILNGIVAQILDKQKYGFVGLDTDGKDFFCNYGHTDSMRLWSIDDAKDGDILATDESVFIYAKVLYNKPYAYCGVDKFGVFKDNCLENNWSNSLDNIYPASKEQRDLLFQKMKENGYEWNANKKELKEIEPNTLDANKVIEWLNDQACLGWIEDVEVDKFIRKFKKDFKL